MFALFPGPLHFEVPEGLESGQKCLLRDVPWHAPQEHLGAVDGVPVATRGQLSGPSADDLWHLQVLLRFHTLELLARVEGARLVRLVEVVRDERGVGGLGGGVADPVGTGRRIPELRQFEALVDGVDEESTRTRRRRLRGHVLRPEAWLLLWLREPIEWRRVHYVSDERVLCVLGVVGGGVLFL